MGSTFTVINDLIAISIVNTLLLAPIMYVRMKYEMHNIYIFLYGIASRCVQRCRSFVQQS